jgi:hypothetical protein
VGFTKIDAKRLAIFNTSARRGNVGSLGKRAIVIGVYG